MDAAHGEADHVEHIQGPQDAEVGPPVLPPLEVHQLLHQSAPGSDEPAVEEEGSRDDHHRELQHQVPHRVPDRQRSRSAQVSFIQFIFSFISFTDDESVSTVCGASCYAADEPWQSLNTRDL